MLLIRCTEMIGFIPSEIRLHSACFDSLKKSAPKCSLENLTNLQLCLWLSQKEPIYKSL